MSKTLLKSVPLWSAVLTLFYLITKHWIGVEVPAWKDISTQIVAILSIVLGV